MLLNHTDAKDTFINVVDYLVNSLNKKMSSFQIGEFTKLTAELKSIVKEKKLT
jgi:hypothetical protein